MRIPVIGRDHSLLYYAARGRALVERTRNVARARRRLRRSLEERQAEYRRSIEDRMDQNVKGSGTGRAREAGD